MKKIILALCALLTLAISCNKEEQTTNQSSTKKLENATLINDNLEQVIINYTHKDDNFILTNIQDLGNNEINVNVMQQTSSDSLFRYTAMYGLSELGVIETYNIAGDSITFTMSNNTEVNFLIQQDGNNLLLTHESTGLQFNINNLALLQNSGKNLTAGWVGPVIRLIIVITVIAVDEYCSD